MMESVDYTIDVRNLILDGLAAVESVLPHFQQHNSDPSEYIKESSRGLLSLLAELYQLRRFARLGAPHIEDFGGFGTGLDDSDAPRIFSLAEGKGDWDFQPWLAEKLMNIERFIFQIYEICDADSSEKSRPDWRRIAHYEDIGDKCCNLLDGIRVYFETILGLIDSGELKITQLKAGDSEFDDSDL